MKRLSLSAVVLLAACAPKLAAGTEAGGIVGSYGWQPAQALQEAQKHCEKYGKAARVSSQNDLQDNMTFDCVPK
jgi:outer membrane biogenesis lipoprotein LolB